MVSLECIEVEERSIAELLDFFNEIQHGMWFGSLSFRIEEDCINFYYKYSLVLEEEIVATEVQIDSMVRNATRTMDYIYPALLELLTSDTATADSVQQFLIQDGTFGRA